MASGVRFSGLFFIVLSSLSSTSNGGIKIQNSGLSQPQTSVSVVIGEVLHLECQVAPNLQPGAVKWYLGEESQRKLIYADIQTDDKDKRVTRNSPGSNTDFTISICNVTLEDAGTYYCVKERKVIARSHDWLRGSGTLVVVEGSPRVTTVHLVAVGSYNSTEQAYREKLIIPIIPIVIGVSGFILVCLLCVVLYIYLKRKEGLRNNQTRSDFIFPEKQQPSKPTSGNKEIVYADLKNPGGLQTPRKIDSGEASEYATIKGAPSGAAEKGTFHSLDL